MKLRWRVFSIILMISVVPGCQTGGGPNDEAPVYLRLFQTGQTTSYATGDDGDLRFGSVWPSPRFTDNGDATVTDGLTGLMWQQSPSVSTADWSSAASAVSMVTTAGYDDWRLPNVMELGSLVCSEQSSQPTWLLAQGFTDVQAMAYWTSTTAAADSAHAWYVDFSNSRVMTVVKTALCHVWVVRGSSVGLRKSGQTISYTTGDDGDLELGVGYTSPRFTLEGDGTIRDNLTGLVWQAGPDSVVRTWSEALSHVATLSTGGRADWRLPNRRELLDLIDFSQAPSADDLIAHGFSGLASDLYWSSTIYAPSTSKAFVFDLTDGSAYNHERTSTARVIAVAGP